MTSSAASSADSSRPASPTPGPGIEGLAFPRLAARTQNFRLGAPRSFTVSPDGTRIAFVRSSGPADRVGRLIVLDVASGAERTVADPLLLLGGDEQLSPEERARRERMRETTTGITAYSTDREVTRAAFALSGSLHVVDLVADAAPLTLEVPGPVVDPRMSPDGRHIAFSAARAFHVVEVATGRVLTLAEPETETVTYGLADFVAAEELDRHRGHWWSPESDAVLVERVDEADVPTWWISDPAHPESAPVPHRYPHAGGTNPAVSLSVLRLDGARVDARWDAASFEYLVTAGWQQGHEPLITVMSRDQRRQQVLTVDTETGATRIEHERTDDAWVEWIEGLPRWAGDGLLLHHDDAASDTRRIVLLADGAEHAVTPVGMQVASVVAADDDALLIAATDDPTTMDLVRVDLRQARGQGPEAAAHVVVGGDDGWHSAVAHSVTQDAVIVVGSMSLDSTRTDWHVRRGSDRAVHVPNLQAGPEGAEPPVRPRVHVHAVTDRALRTAVLLPRDHVPGTSLPVVMSPYGGPHHLEVVAAGRMYAEDQFIADQGFAVVIVDGRGTPLRGPRWDRSIKHDVAGPILEDQVAALQAVAAQYPDLDLDRVGIRGWSFGGYLAALAVMDRPDVFHAAVAGAPVTDWRLYDTAYTERYLDHPDTEPAAYERTDLMPRAASLTRPLLVIHGLADDNVVAAHSVRLSGALLAAGRPHSFLPLSGVTHMTPQEVVSENLLRLQVEFLRESLG